MKYDRYEGSTAPDLVEYRFKSTGPNGEITIKVQFKTTVYPNVVTLEFGKALANGEIDYHVKNNNDDRNKILGTVANYVYEFTARYPEKVIWLDGSTPSRTRLYRMAISVNLEELLETYNIFGVYATESGLQCEEFKKQMPYKGFSIQRKKH